MQLEQYVYINTQLKAISLSASTQFYCQGLLHHEEYVLAFFLSHMGSLLSNYLCFLGEAIKESRHFEAALNIEFTLFTAEDILFQCDLYLQFIPPINLWKICIDLRPFSKYFNEPFSRTLRSPRSNNLEIQNDENSK